MGRALRLWSGVQLGEASSRLPECLVELLWVGKEGHHQGVDHREPTQPLLVVATQRLRKPQIQMLKKREDGLVVHHEAACLGTSQLVDRALPTVRLLQLVGENALSRGGPAGADESALQLPAGTDDDALLHSLVQGDVGRRTRGVDPQVSSAGHRRSLLC
jgi:hypothetical protein